MLFSGSEEIKCNLYNRFFDENHNNRIHTLHSYFYDSSSIKLHDFVLPIALQDISDYGIP